jgi:hypothetical protein
MDRQGFSLKNRKTCEITNRVIEQVHFFYKKGGKAALVSMINFYSQWGLIPKNPLARGSLGLNLTHRKFG